MKKILLLLFVLITSKEFNAQTIDSVTIIIDTTSYCCFGDEGTNDGNEISMNFWVKSSTTTFASQCFLYNNSPMNANVNENVYLKGNNVPISTLLEFEGFEDDCNNPCEYGGCCGCAIVCLDCDDTYGGLEKVGLINYNFSPERFYKIYDTLAANGGYNIGGKVWAKYSFPLIDSPLIYRKNTLNQSLSSPPIICPNDTLYLKTDYKVQQSVTSFINGIKTGVKFKWEVQLNFSGNWKVIDTTLDSTFIFVPIDKFPEFDTMALQGDLSFKVTALGEEGSRTSSSTNYKIMPRAPRATVSPFASCPGQSNGKVDINFISGVGSSYRYILKNGFNQNTGCDPDSNNCFTGQASSGTNVTAPNYTIPSIGAGQYTLWLINEGGYKGSCYNTYNVEVTSLPNFNVTLDSSRNVTCKNGSDGAIFLHSNKTFPVYSIQPLSNAPSASYMVQDTIFKIQNLKQGTYSVSVKDYCNVYTTPINVTITEPTRVVGTITQSVSPTCVSPANGTITIEADSGSGSYNYLVYKSGVVVSSLLNSTSKIYNATGLSEGTYKIEIQDAARPTCAGFLQFVDLTYPTTMTMTDSIVHLTCYQSGNGQVFLTGSGNSTGYNYSLFSYTNGTSNSNTNGQFTNLSQGFYKEILKRNIVGCLDSIIRDSAYISQPNPITTSMTKKNVSCLGKDDGFITVVANGGTPSYTYQWEFKTSSGWSFYSASGNPATITNLYPAIYRVKVIDANMCNVYSDSVDVREPNALQFDSIKTNNIKCFGETATIEGYASGGTAPYTYSYSLDNGVTFSNFTSSTGLYSGTYKVKLSDANGCSVIYPTEQIINSPSQPLSFDYQLSDFNGYAVSCKNSSNGTITLSSKGGNDYGYTGYFYSINTGGFVSNPVFNSINAGTYNLSVKDGRGCIVSKPIVLNEPNELMSVVQSIDTLKCGNDTNGRIIISTIGGVSPFYGKIINVSDYISGTIFSNLKLGNYNFEIKDANGCIDTIATAMVSKYPKLLYNFTSSDVKCFGGNTGSIKLNPYGGLAPYQFNWINQNIGNTGSIQNLTKGIYSFEIIDDVQCKIVGSTTITQPDILQFELIEVPVCPSSLTGEFRINAQGGTKPYIYAIDTNLYSSDRIIKNISPFADYTIFVKDSNQCISTKIGKVNVFTDSVKADFVISTNEMTIDTIRAVDITNPKPDSIQWSFSSGTNVIIKNNAYTEVYYTAAGNYNITMRTFNKLCENIVSKNTNIKIKDTSIYRPYLTSIIDSFHVYPIPSNGICNLYLSTSKIYPLIFIQVTSNLGTIVYTKSYNNLKLVEEPLDLTQLAKGTYYLRVFVENDYRVKVIIIE